MIFSSLRNIKKHVDTMTVYVKIAYQAVFLEFKLKKKYFF